MGSTESQLARFIVETDEEDIPPGSFRAASQACFDCVGVALAGAAQPLGSMMRGFVEEQGGNPVCTVIGTSLRTSPYMAALANGTLGHALDYDDMGGYGHPSVSLLPTALAVGEQLGVSGKEVLTAYVIGFEVAAHLSAGSNSPQGISGFHSTAVFGTMGATAVACRLLGLDQQQTLMALGMAGSMPSGILQNFGTYTKPLHAGMSCRSGVLAAYLARDGWKATDSFIESKVGWAHAYLGEGKYDPQRMVEGLGNRWLSEEAIVIKKYPCCGSNHSALDSILGLMAEHKVRYQHIAEVEVDNLPAISHVLLYPRPAYGFQGKFSIHYNVATALLDGRVNVSSYGDDKLHRPEFREALDKVEVKVLSNWDPRGPRENPVRMILKDGRVLERSTDRTVMHGTASDPLTEAELKEKFRYCAGLTLSAAQAQEALKSWWELEQVPNVADALRTVALR